MKYRIARKKLNRSTVSVWAKSLHQWIQANDVFDGPENKDAHMIVLRFINYDKKQAIKAGNKVGITRTSQIMKYFNNELRKL